MKKLTMFAAAMTIVGGAYASVCSPSDVSSPCDTPVWDFVMSGKTANNNSNKGYKTTTSIALKGALAGNVVEKTTTVPGTRTVTTEFAGSVVNNPGYSLASNEVVVTTGSTSVQVPAVIPVPTSLLPVTITTTERVLVSNVVTSVSTLHETVTRVLNKFVTTTIVDASTQVGTGECCIESFDVYMYDKSDKSMRVIPEQLISKMTIFGKGFVSDRAIPGKSYTVESDVLWTIDDGTAEEDDYLLLQFVGFGKGKLEYSEGGDAGSVCNPDPQTPCEPTYSWPSWSGWFTGWGGVDTDSVDLACEGQCVAVAGGTWSAKYNKSLSNSSDVEAAIFSKFKVAFVVE